jgi:hypothetical protein
MGSFGNFFIFLGAIWPNLAEITPGFASQNQAFAGGPNPRVVFHRGAWHYPEPKPVLFLFPFFPSALLLSLLL